ncbi:MAG: ribosomal-processing cysteine protease Prp, partial [Clostridia bacterium]|nr:ribosomal-processing cysteine protease Prp [Clostridia bacterium]
MTRVTLYHDAEGRLSGFSCKGHAGYAEAGSDIVCAAVSALSITCCN